jgi:hypothetical protein
MIEQLVLVAIGWTLGGGLVGAPGVRAHCAPSRRAWLCGSDATKLINRRKRRAQSG